MRAGAALEARVGGVDVAPLVIQAAEAVVDVDLLALALQAAGDRPVGIQRDAVKLKFIDAPLSKERLAELIQIPPRKK